ncbi:YjgB family protein [Virgibacillus dakarensis]|uniref:YjgB family protein n=1 Tax=Virgibacillus dakarensis TaxID=1917889 RepID=UPI000B445E09|nr:YjgB family protein [Virgibacillus dakarensis]
MNVKKGLLVGATAFGFALSGAGLSSVAADSSDTSIPASSVSGIHSSITNQEAAEYLNNIYDQAFTGEMPSAVHGLKINKSTKRDVHQKLGSPQKVKGQFDLYSWNMGNPGYGFSYNKDNTISEIRNFGTGVERQTNLGGITPAVLSEQIGSPDKILAVPDTNEMDFVYETGDYELHFVVGSDQTVDHVNLKEAK